MKIELFPKTHYASVYFETRESGKKMEKLMNQCDLILHCLSTFNGLSFILKLNPCYTLDECVTEIKRLYATTTAQK